MLFENFIAFRYLGLKKTPRYLLLLTFISLLGILISVFSFLVIHSVMNGFSTYLRKALIGFNAHIVVSSAEDASINSAVLSWFEEQKEVAEVVPIIEFDGIIETSSGVVGSGKVRGMRNADLNKNENLVVSYFEDEEEVNLKGDQHDLPGILLGEELYVRLQFFPGEEERISIIFPFGDIGPTGEIEPRRREFRVVGILSTGFYDFDTRYVFIDNEEAARLSGDDQKQKQILIRLKEGIGTSRVLRKFNEKFPDISVATWEERNKRLFSALKLERSGMFLLLSIVTFIASFNLLALMMLLAVRRVREVALFYALGLGKKTMQRIFLGMGALLGVLGTLLGFVFGFVVLYLLKIYPPMLPPAYYLEYLPVRIDPWMVLILAVMAPLFAVIASIGPAYLASKARPMEVLRST